MNYWLLKRAFKDHTQRKRVADNLIALRKQLTDEIPAKDAEDNLLLATWNIRDLGKVNGWGYGPRLPESPFYIAEILSRFDFIAIQEVNELREWDEIVGILGPNWSYLASDVTDPALGGNGERLTYLYDKRRVWFRNIVGEIVLPPKLLVSEAVEERKEDQPADAKLESKTVGRQFARSPYLASFQASWLKFDICTVHIYYGEESGAKLKRRVEEINRIASYFGKRADRALDEGKALVLLGDFNIVNPEHETMQALVKAGFVVPKALRQLTNVDHDAYYDQIAFKTRPGVIDYLDTTDGKKRAGTFPIFKHLFTPEQLPDYKAAASKTKDATDAAAAAKAKKEGKPAPKPQTLDAYYSDWRTWQLSDHQPLWVQLHANDSDTYLKTTVLDG